jgi:hypothetical protein
MITVILTDDAVTVANAIQWCSQTLPNNKGWDMQADFSAKTKYRFEFDDARYATLFALKWVH